MSRTAAEPNLVAYVQESEQPLASLVFLLPLLVFYEMGTRLYAAEISDIKAFSLMREFFGLFGATARNLPALAVAAILLACHIARQDPWRFRASTLAGMAVESVACAMPLILVVLLSGPRHPGLWVSQTNFHGLLVLSVGAGIYEELVFRLVAFTLLNLLLLDLLRFRKLLGLLLMVVLPAVLFAFYHYLGHESFQWRSLVFRTTAGIYFGMIFLLRGFGITAGAHAFYDVIIVFFMARSAGI